MRDEFSGGDIEMVLGIPTERLRQWMKMGYISPTIPAPGQGSKAIFNRTAMYGIALFAKLVDMGLKREQASEYVKRFISYEVMGQVGYIGFQSVIRNGQRVFISTPWWTEDSPMTIEIREKMTLGIKGGGQKKEWDHIDIINCIKLRKDVDTKLKVVE